jgi:hypothetical protein
LDNLPARISEILEHYIAQLNSIDSILVDGIYLTGSVALGDYYSKKSDIDFITVLHDAPATEIVYRLKQIHHHIETTYGYPKLNGYYVTIEEIKNKQACFPSFFRNKMYAARTFELDKFALYELKTSSLTCYGVPAAELPVHLNINEVNEQLHQNINSYWSTWIAKHSLINLNHLLLILFPRLTEWGVLGVARQLYTIETGKITSKLSAGTYCLDKLPAQFQHIILTAIKTRRVNKTQLKPSFGRAQETLHCMKFIISKFNQTYNDRIIADRF